MSSSKEYLNYILEQLAPLEEIAYRPMMGEYILYYQGKVVGGIYDDRLLVKPVKSAVAYLPGLCPLRPPISRYETIPHPKSMSGK